MIRVVVASNGSGSREEVCFTEDTETDAEDFFFMEDMAINSDGLIDIDDMPSCFPMDYVLIRK